MSKTKWMAAAVWTLAGPAALAQSSVTIYGRMDAGLVHGKFSPAGSNLHLISGPYTASRLGFRGSEDLGGGLRASFGLESGLNLASGNGGASGGGLNFNRGSQVALSGTSWGEVALGRMYMPTFWVYLASDPGIGGLGLGSMGAAIIQQHTALTGNSGWGGFYDNTVRYRTPTVGGVKAELAYSGNREGIATGIGRNDGRTFGFNLQYEQGPLYLGAAYLRNTAELAAAAASTTQPPRLKQDENQRSWMLAGRYKIAPATIGINFGKVTNNVAGSAGACVTVQANGNANGCDMQTFLVSTRLDIGTQGALDLSVAQLRATSGGLDGARARSLSIGYTHYLSKRTWLYGQAVTMRNNAQAPWGLNAGLGGVANNGTAGLSPHAFSLGMLHMF